VLATVDSCLRVGLEGRLIEVSAGAARGKPGLLCRAITAEAAIELGREVLAVPGSIFSPLSVGSHGPIRDGAGLVQNARDVLAAIGVGREVLDDPLRPPKGAGFELGKARDGLLLHLSETMAVSASELPRRVQLPIAEVVGRLTSLELEGAVRRHGSGYLRALRRGK